MESRCRSRSRSRSRAHGVPNFQMQVIRSTDIQHLQVYELSGNCLEFDVEGSATVLDAKQAIQNLDPLRRPVNKQRLLNGDIILHDGMLIGDLDARAVLSLVQRTPEQAAWIEKVARCGGWLELFKAPEHIREDREIILSAVRWNGMALQCCDLKDDVEIVEVALQQTASALKFASPRIRSLLQERVVQPRPVKRRPVLYINAFVPVVFLVLVGIIDIFCGHALAALVALAPLAALAALVARDIWLETSEYNKVKFTAQVGETCVAKSADGAMWPVTMTDKHPDGTFGVNVHDPAGTHWPRIDCVASSMQRPPEGIWSLGDVVCHGATRLK